MADPNDPGRGGDYLSLAIEVGEHAEPVGEMKRIYYTTQRRLGYRTFSHVEGPDVIELKRMLHAIGVWRPTLAVFPEAPKAPNARELQELRRTNPAQADKVQAEGRAAAVAYARDYAQFDAEAVAAVDAFRKDQTLTYAGNPPGLVDERLVKALRAAYAQKRGPK